MTTPEFYNNIYKSPGAAWTREEPPEKLVKLIEGETIRPCKTLDIGCGEGLYSIYLASCGFDVTGIDISDKAIGYARKNAEKGGVDVQFVAMNALDLGDLDEKFDFIFEWGFLHQIMPDKRVHYVKQVSERPNPGGKYLSMCFHDQSSEFGGTGKKHRTGEATGNKLYFSSQEELQELFEPHFEIIESKIIEAKGGKRTDGGMIKHSVNFFLMERK